MHTAIMVAAEGASSTVAQAMSDVTTVFSAATNMVTESPLAMVFIGLSIAGAGIGLFHRLVPSSN